MPTNDPVLEVLREMRGDLVLVTTELGRLVRHAEYTNARLDEHGELLREHGELLREHGERLEALEQHTAATSTAIGVLTASVRAIVPALEQGRLRDDRLVARVDECERRIDALEER